MVISEEENGLGDDADIEAGLKKQRRPALPRTKNDQIPDWEKVRLLLVLVLLVLDIAV